MTTRTPHANWSPTRLWGKAPVRPLSHNSCSQPVLMPLLETVIEISVSAAEAWELLIDTRRWPDWGPSVVRVDCADRCIGPGTIGRVQTAIGLWLPFQITKFTAGQYWHWRVAGIPATGHRVESIGPNLCRVLFEVPVLAAPYLIICRLAAHRIKNILEEKRPPA